MIAPRCQRENTRLRQLLDGQLTEAQTADMTRHIGECDVCRQKLESLAAGPDWWDDAQQFLSSDAADPLAMDEHSSSGEPSPTVIEPYDLVSGFLEPANDPTMLGRLDGYDILEVIGQGGMGIVFRGYDRQLARHVAIKVLAPHYATSAAARRRFAREAQAAAAVVHPHVLAIHGVNGSSRLPHIVMPLVSGPSLQRRIDTDGPLETRDVLRIGMQAAQGLSAAHAQGLVHRDVKPANILLENGVERVLLTDFGLARAIDDVSLTHSGVIAGTPQYMSPEQARGDAVDYRTDLFSLGSVLYTMCAGRPPFRADSTFGVMRRICNATPRDLREINPDVPHWLWLIIRRLLAKDRDDRFQSAAEVASLLEGFLAHLQHPTAVPPPRFECALPEKAVDHHQIARPPLVGSLVTIAAAVVLACAGWVFWPAAAELTVDNQDADVQNQNADSQWHDDIDPTISAIGDRLNQLRDDGDW